MPLFERLAADGGIADEVVAHYLPRLRAFVRARVSARLRVRESDSDIVQSVCRVVLQDRDRLDFASEAKFRAWLFTTALNKIRMKARFWERDRRSPLRELASDQDGVEQLEVGYSGVCSPSRIASAREQVERLERALERLPDEYREVIAMARLARIPHAEIAEQLGRSVGATRQLLGTALRRLADELETD